MIYIKICGITNEEDALTCVKYGVSAIGFVFAKSKRQVTPEKAREISGKLSPFITRVGVFKDEDPFIIKDIMKKVRLDLAQLHGNETPEMAEILEGRVIKAFKAGIDLPDDIWKDIPLRAILLDTFSEKEAGGTGKPFDWQLFNSYRALGHHIILAGGINSGNIIKAIEMTNPDGIDLSSGVEKSPGIKDEEKIKNLMTIVHKRWNGVNEN